MRKIEWCDETWNPVVGCSVVSPGCTNCYAMRQADRIRRMTGDASHYFGTTKVVNGKPVWTGKVALASDETLTAPLRWKRPRAIFVNSMGDLFHESVPDEWIDRVFAVMALAPQHAFIVLTKRAKRMREYCSTRDGMGNALICQAINEVPANMGNRHGALEMPLPNVILGVSAEDQDRADERIPDLLATPAAKRVVSAEPLLGPIDFFDAGGFTDPNEQFPLIDCVIVGGESGPGARPLHPEWVRSIREDCVTAGVAFFFKQWGEWGPSSPKTAISPHSGWMALRGGLVQPKDARLLYPENGAAFVERLGKRAAGRLLDGREHNDLPWGLTP